LDPYCTYNCPTEAMTFGDADDPQSPFSTRKQELLDLGYSLFQLPAFEGTRSEIYYIDKQHTTK
ncbi:MAG: hypothetical protein LBP28_06610, partial [Coriobacteriales bacterium]|nr:hypothetical protein [Coriobacteriales bacterium]